MLTTLLLMAISVPQIDIFQSPPNTYANQQYTFNCDMYGNARRSFSGSGLHTVYVGSWNQDYTVPWNDWTVRVTGAEAYESVVINPEPCTIALLALGAWKVRKK